MRKILLVVCLCASSAAFATPAIWTGNKQKIETSDGGTKWKCEYKIAYTVQMILFWRTFSDGCPSQVEVYF
jgi:hypothetical protein